MRHSTAFLSFYMGCLDSANSSASKGPFSTPGQRPPRRNQDATFSKSLILSRPLELFLGRRCGKRGVGDKKTNTWQIVFKVDIDLPASLLPSQSFPLFFFARTLFDLHLGVEPAFGLTGRNVSQRILRASLGDGNGKGNGEMISIIRLIKDAI